MTDFKGKKAAVLGFGIEGESATNFLLSKNAKISVFDVREESHLDAEKIKEFKKKGVSFHFGSYPQDFSKFDFAVRSPGISPLSPVIARLKEQGIEVTSETKIFFDLAP